MPEIIVKKGQQKLDHYPEQQKAQEIGAKKWEKIQDDVGPGRTFESEGEKRDYLRAVNSNPANVPGIPAFLPGVELKLMMSDVKAARECVCGGCAVARDAYRCPKCGEYVRER